MNAAWRRMVGTCMAAGHRWHCKYCESGPGAFASLVRDAAAARLRHVLRQREYVAERDRRARLHGRARTVRNGGRPDSATDEIGPGG